MPRLQLLLIVLFACLSVYTAVVAASHGFGLLPIFFGDIAAMGWPGQFNVDFTSFLILSALWIAWRHQFSGLGIVLGLVALFCGGLFFTAYLFIAHRRADGNMKILLLGEARARL